MNSDTLSAVCDTLLPTVDTPEAGPIGEFLRLRAAQLGVDQTTATAIPALAVHARTAVIELVDSLSSNGFAHQSQTERTAALLRAGDRDERSRLAIRVLKALTFGAWFSTVGPDGTSVAWDAAGYPGPLSAPPPPEAAPKTLPVLDIDAAESTMSADVCIVGSGAGGSVIAARLAATGRKVLVLEAGPYRTESDFLQTESAARDLYLGGGMLWSETGNLGLLAGSALGGGTVVNSMVCLRPPDDIRRQWADLGLDGVDGPAFDEFIDAVWERLGVNVEATHYNANTERMVAGLTARGYGYERLARNASLDDDPRFCGYCNWGCQQGCKRSTVKTYLEDAAGAGARFVVGCQAERIITRSGKAAGVQATIESGGQRRRLLVEAPTVVVAAGGLESPALLLRSQIGGPAVGKHLAVHPAWIVTGIYADPINAWSGQIQSAVSFELTHCEGGGGFLVESLTLNPGFWAGQMAFTDGRRHKLEMLKMPHMASWHAVAHDEGSGEVRLDHNARPLVRWDLQDDLDRRIAARAHVEMARLHHAARAQEIFTFHFKERRWRGDEDFDDYLRALAATPSDQYSAFSAHQMSSCRMGADPTLSVADARGQLHDTKGVWIGDASALPSAPGVNPMITIMALAERTASHMKQTG